MAVSSASKLPRCLWTLISLAICLVSLCGRFWATLVALLWRGRMPDYNVSVGEWWLVAAAPLRSVLSRTKLLGYSLLFAVAWSGHAVLHSFIGVPSSNQENFRGRTLEVPSMPWLTHHTIKLNGVRLHYVESGERSGELVLFLHGFAEFWYSWRFQLDYLRHCAWVVAVDLPGTGNSDKRHQKHIYSVKSVAKLMQHFIAWLDKEHCVLVGSDSGALIGWQILENAPTLITHFISLSQPMPHVILQALHSSFRRKWKARFLYVFQLPWLPEYILSAQYMRFFLEEYRRLVQLKSFSEQDMSAYHFTFSEPEDWFGAVTYFRHFFPAAYSHAPDHCLDTPCLLIFGEEDGLVPPSDWYRSLSYLNRGEVEVIRGKRRRLSEHSPSDINRLIKKFACLRTRENIFTITTRNVNCTEEWRAEKRWPGLGTVIYHRALGTFQMATNMLDIYNRSLKYMK